MKSLAVLPWIFLGMIACNPDNGPPLEISNVTVFAALPGTSTSVAYMTLRNNTQVAISIGKVWSPQFDSVTLHETQIENGIAYMQPLESFEIPANSSLALKEGGKHLMLMNATPSLSADEPATLQFQYDNVGLITVNTIIQPRFANERSD